MHMHNINNGSHGRSSLSSTFRSIPWRVLLPLHLCTIVLLRQASWYGHQAGVYRRGLAGHDAYIGRPRHLDWEYNPPAGDICGVVNSTTVPDESYYRSEYGPTIGPLLLRYTLLHRSMLCDPAPLSSKRVLIHHGVGGLGNQMQGLVSSLLLAVLTDRALVTTHTSGGCNFLGELFAPGGGDGGGGSAAAIQTTLTPALARSLWLSHIPRVSFGDVTDPLRQPGLACDDLSRGRYGKVIALEVHTGEYLAPLFELGHFREKMRHLGLDRERWFQPFARYLFRPSAVVQKAMATDSTMRCDIGIHIRRSLHREQLQIDSEKNSNDDEKKEKVQPELITPWLGCLGRVLGDSSASNNSTGAQLKKKGPTKKSRSILVASDHTRAVDEVRKWSYKSKKKSSSENGGSTTIWSLIEQSQDRLKVRGAKSESGWIADSSRRSSSSHRCSAAVVMAAAELLTLSKCKEMVTTSKSSFGMMAAAMAGANPYVVANVDPETGRPTLAELQPDFHDGTRNGCIRQRFSSPIYLETSHLPYLPCVMPGEVIRQLSNPGPCDVGFCGQVCHHHEESSSYFALHHLNLMSWTRSILYHAICLALAVIVTTVLRRCGLFQICRLPGRQIKGNVNNWHLRKGELAALVSLVLVLFLIGSAGRLRFGLLHNFERGYEKVEKSFVNMDEDHKRYKLDKH